MRSVEDIAWKAYKCISKRKSCFNFKSSMCCTLLSHFKRNHKIIQLSCFWYCYHFIYFLCITWWICNYCAAFCYCLYPVSLVPLKDLTEISSHLTIIPFHHCIVLTFSSGNYNPSTSSLAITLSWEPYNLCKTYLSLHLRHILISLPFYLPWCIRPTHLRHTFAFKTCWYLKDLPICLKLLVTFKTYPYI